MEIRTSKTLKFAALGMLTGFILTSCNSSPTASATDPTTDGGNVVLSQEANNMGAVLNDSTAGGISKTAAVAFDTDTVTAELIIVPRHYDDTCQCFVRTSQFTSSVGFERQRTDSIWLDSSGILLSLFHPGHADSITHDRMVTQINSSLGKEINLSFHTTLVRQNGTTTYQWSGTIVGTFNGVEFKSISFDVTRTWVSFVGFGYPVGSIIMLRGNYQIVFDFTGTGTEVCTVTLNNVFVRQTHISITGVEE